MEVMQCSKCKAISGDSWPCPGGKCPLPFSPKYDSETHAKYGDWQKVKVPNGKHAGARKLQQQITSLLGLRFGPIT